MIQRQQSLWLLLTTATGILSLIFPFATGTELVEKTAMQKPAEIIAGNSFPTLILTIASIGVSIIAIFLFKNRKQQLNSCLVGILLSVFIIVVYIMQMNKLIKPTLALYCILPFAVLAGFIMAARGIWKDEKLVKTLDKLR